MLSRSHNAVARGDETARLGRFQEISRLPIQRGSGKPDKLPGMDLLWTILWDAPGTTLARGIDAYQSAPLARGGIFILKTVHWYPRQAVVA